MKIISWNCAGAFRKKYQQIEALNPDILIIQECENPDKYRNEFKNFSYKDYIWEGENESKGIGIFFKPIFNLNKLNWNGTYSIIDPDFKSNLTTWKTNELKQFISVSITNDLNLLAVWTKGKDNQIFKYIGQFWKFILANKEHINEKPTIMIGDFNSNTIWDKIDRWWNHSEVIKILDSWNYRSLYHEINLESQGNEKTPTFYLQRKLEKPYHIDYIFIPKSFINKSRLEIGKYKDWIHLSDHMPLIFEYDSN